MTQEAPLYMVVNQIVRSFKDKGATLPDIAKLFKEHKQWKPTSISPALSQLRDCGLLRMESEFGVRRWFSDKEPTEKDWEKYRRDVSNYEHKRRSNGKDTSEPKMLLEVGEKDTVTLTFKQAQMLYKQLGKIFGGK